jgi:glycosyltransferase involved in cell wall biosynthesis
VAQPRIRVIRVIARLNVGGPAKHVVWLTEGLGEPEFDSLLVAGSVPAGEEDMGYFAEEHGVTPLYIPEMSREISLLDAVTIWKLFRLFVRERPDIVHTHTAKAGTVGRIAGFFYRWLTPATLVGKPRRCSFIHTYHGHIFHSYYGRVKTRLFIQIEKTLAWLVTDQILAISEQQRREINEQFRIGNSRQFRVVPLGLDLDLFSSWKQKGKKFRQELGLNQDTFVVGIVGRLTEIKNHSLFFEAIAEYRNSGGQEKEPTKFVVVGEGLLRQELETRAKNLGITSDLIFAGGRRDPDEFYPALDVVALTSRNEGTPLTLIEAMANARPVISTRVGGVVDLLGRVIASSADFDECERGISVSPGDAKAFAAGMVRLATDAELRTELGARGLVYVQQTYRKSRLIDDIKNLYRELMSDKL